jgi:hypothetical protein
VQRIRKVFLNSVIGLGFLLFFYSLTIGISIGIIADSLKINSTAGFATCAQLVSIWILILQFKNYHNSYLSNKLVLKISIIYGIFLFPLILLITPIYFRNLSVEFIFLMSIGFALFGQAFQYGIFILFRNGIIRREKRRLGLENLDLIKFKNLTLNRKNFLILLSVVLILSLGLSFFVLSGAQSNDPKSNYIKLYGYSKQTEKAVNSSIDEYKKDSQDISDSVNPLMTELSKLIQVPGSDSKSNDL